MSHIGRLTGGFQVLPDELDGTPEYQQSNDARCHNVAVVEPGCIPCPGREREEYAPANQHGGKEVIARVHRLAQDGQIGSPLARQVLVSRDP